VLFRSFRNYVVLERALRARFGNAAKYPKEIVAEISFGLLTNATGAPTRKECLDLYVYETRSS
jgi:hypothetical protein